MEPEASLPCSQRPTTGPYPEPDLSSPYILLVIHLSVILNYWTSSNVTNLVYSTIRYTFLAEFKNAWSYTSTPPIRLHGVVLS